MTKPLYQVREFESLKELMRMSVELYGERSAFEVKRDNGELYYISYREYGDAINALGTALIDMGYKDARIAVAGESCYEWCLSYMAVVNGVGVVVPTDKELMFEDINGILNTAEVKLLFCDRKLIRKLNLSEVKKDLTIVCFHQDEDKDGILSFEKLLEKGKKLLDEGKRDYLDAVIDPEKMCTLLFTSGTTGTSKGVMLCHRNFCADVIHTMQVVKINPEDCGISLLPLHHTYESTIILFCAPYSGAKVTFCEGFKYVLKNMKEFNPSIFVSVPLILETVHRRIIKAIKQKPHGEFKFKVGKVVCKAASNVGIDLKKVFFKEIQETFGGHMRLIICGAAPINPQILKDFDAFGIQILFGYGLTECAPLVIINNDKLRLAESIGLPLPSVEAKIKDPDPQTGVGEILVKGPMVMLGYYNNPEATAEVIDEDGFFHTGDLGKVDKKGRFYISGRSKNVIVTQNGKNIYPEELEYHLSKYPIVKDSLVYADTDRKGTAVKAKIYPDMDEISEILHKKTKEISDKEVEKLIKEVIDSVNASVPQFKHIVGFTLRKKPFTMTTTHKVQRFKKENLED